MRLPFLLCSYIDRLAINDNEVTALNHVNVKFKRVEMTAIMGPSGSGKSTLMHCMAGLGIPSSGQVVVEGLEVSSMSQKQLTDLRREQIGNKQTMFVMRAYMTDKKGTDMAQVKKDIKKVVKKYYTISVFGTLMGLIVGVAAGVVIRAIHASEGLETLAIPWPQLLAFLLLSLVVGLFSSISPASRALKKPRLDAVAGE